jgi:sulfate transport system permease protein
MREITPRSPWAFLLIAVVLGYAGFLLIAPIVSIVNTVFSRGFEPINDTLSNPNFQHALNLTFVLAIGATIINTVFGVVVVWVLERQDFRFRWVLNLLVDIPFVFSPVIAGFVLIVLFGRDGWIDPPFAIAFAVPGMLLAKTFVCLPFIPRELGPVLGHLSREPEYAAYTLGASRWKTFLRVVLPSIWVGIVYGVVLTLSRALGEFGAVAVVSGGIQGKTETATMFIYRALLDRNRIGGYTVALILGVIAIILLVVMTGLQSRLKQNQEQLTHVDSTQEPE